MQKLKVVQCDFENPDHCRAEIALMREYMMDKMGTAKPLDNEGNMKLIEGLKNHPSALVLLAEYDGEFVGLTNGFVNFGTFLVSNFLNIHDVIVKKSHRGLGIGKKLLEENIRIAKKELDCAKITLEVRADNEVAQNLYKLLGFKESEPVMHFRTKFL